MRKLRLPLAPWADHKGRPYDAGRGRFPSIKNPSAGIAANLNAVNAKTARTGNIRYRLCQATNAKYSGQIQKTTSVLLSSRRNLGLSFPGRCATTSNIASIRGLKSWV